MDQRVRALVYRLVPAPLRLQLMRRYYADRVRHVPILEPEAALLGRFVRAGDVVADIGANFGWYTYRLSTLVGPDGSVHAFEPVADTAAVLQHVVHALRLSNVRVHACAVADREGNASMDVPRDALGAKNYYLAHLDMAAPAPAAATPVRTLDALRRDGMGRCSFVKCDVEGAEMLVVKGAEAMLASDRPAILCEVCDHGARFGYAPRDIFEFLAARRYRSYRALEGELVAAPGPVPDADNYFFVPEERDAAVAGGA